MIPLIQRCLQNLTKKGRVLVSITFKPTIPLHIFTSLHIKHTVAHLNGVLPISWSIWYFFLQILNTHLYQLKSIDQVSEPMVLSQPEISCCLYIHTQCLLPVRKKDSCPVHKFVKYFIFALYPYHSPNETINLFNYFWAGQFVLCKKADGRFLKSVAN